LTAEYTPRLQSKSIVSKNGRSSVGKLFVPSLVVAFISAYIIEPFTGIFFVGRKQERIRERAKFFLAFSGSSNTSAGAVKCMRNRICKSYETFIFRVVCFLMLNQLLSCNNLKLGVTHTSSPAVKLRSIMTPNYFSAN
jgi:hypothetical protein